MERDYFSTVIVSIKRITANIDDSPIILPIKHTISSVNNDRDARGLTESSRYITMHREIESQWAESETKLSVNFRANDSIHRSTTILRATTYYESYRFRSGQSDTANGNFETCVTLRRRIPLPALEPSVLNSLAGAPVYAQRESGGEFQGSKRTHPLRKCMYSPKEILLT